MQNPSVKTQKDKQKLEKLNMRIHGHSEEVSYVWGRLLKTHSLLSRNKFQWYLLNETVALCKVCPHSHTSAKFFKKFLLIKAFEVTGICLSS